MAEYTKVFENPYPNGWEDLPSENTPITAEALQEHTDAIEHLEEYLEENPIMDGTDVQWNQIVESGEEIAEITIDGETTKVYAPKGGGGGGEAFVEMTKAEYDALPDTKLTDGVPRLITDYTEGSSGEIYDDTERVIGTWFGKPLYRRVVKNPSEFSIAPNTWKVVDGITVGNISMKDFRFTVGEELVYSGLGGRNSAEKLQFMHFRNATLTLYTNTEFVMEYTKAGD